MAWLPVADAAAALGISDDTVRRRAKRGDLPSQDGPDGRLLVETPDVEPQPDPQPAGCPAAAEDASEAPAAAVLDAPALLREVEHLRELLGERESRIRDLAAELTAARERAVADAVERAELRRMLAVLLPQLPERTPEREPQDSRSTDAANPQPRRHWWHLWQ